LDKFNVCPHMSAYMLGYSKMIMQSSFQHLARNGCRLLYTDTDSIVFAATPSQWEVYRELFVPISKTLGGMECEGVFNRFVCVGPKKYCCVEANGDYEWHANGVRARQGVDVDVLKTFERILAGSTEHLPHFSMTAQKNFEIRHSTDASKTVRFICLKGALRGEGRDVSLRWWRDFTEFGLHAMSLKPIGYQETEVSDDGATPVEALVDGREKRGVQPKDSKVYILTDETSRTTYVGCSNNVSTRLRQHNREISKGAAATAGGLWSISTLWGGFKDRKHALSFETRLQNICNPIAHAQVIAKEREFAGIFNEPGI
jgi:predicted GIY-YIG superfamily endonuclease